jgi:dihydroxyacetone kinase-like protein
MSRDTIDASAMRALLRSAALKIEQEEAALNALDAAIGDGDHGITMRIGFHAVDSALALAPSEASLSEVLTAAGKAFMGKTGGAIGVIFGRMLMAGGSALVNIQEIGAPELKIMLDAMEAGVVKAGKAQPDDKTLLDSLHAACESLNSLSAENSLREAACRAADAAEQGAQDTAAMTCRVGRASRLGDRVIGHKDPGAVSFSMVLRAMADWIVANSSEGASL